MKEKSLVQIRLDTNIQKEIKEYCKEEGYTLQDYLGKLIEKGWNES